MAVPGDFNDPSLASKDLGDDKLKLAYQEGHDADIPSNLGVYNPSHAGKGTPVDHSQDLEKGGSSATPTIEDATGEEDATEPPDPNIVWWDGDQDPANPMNWNATLKWGNVLCVSLLSLITPLASSMFAPGVPQVMEDFKTNNNSLATFVVSVYVLGFAVGPLFVAPLSEMYGRLPLYGISNTLFVVFSAACALATDMGMLCAFRFFMGCVGAAPLVIGGGTIADLMPAEKRGGAMAIWAMGPLLGPVIGPVAGGYLVEAKGWRWVFWLLAIMGGAIALGTFCFLRESYGPVILSRKAARLRKETGNPNLKSKLDTGMTTSQLLRQSLVRPTKMVLTSPVVSILCLYTAVVYGILYLLFTTFTFVFERIYGFSSGNVGLTYIGIGVGMIIGLGVLGFGSDRIARNVIARGETLKPEHRMPLILSLPGACCIPCGLFIYGWTAEYHTHWAIPLFGTLLIGFGLISIFMCIQTYLVDAFTVHAASAMAANSVLRSIFGAVIPLGGLQMYDVLGLGWGNSLLGFVALALVPVPVLFRFYGERIRTNPRFQVKL